MKRKNIQKIKENKGFTTADIVTTVVIIMIFIGIITTLFYQFYITTTAKNRNAIATNCIIDVIEHIKTMNYDEIEASNLDLEIATLNIPNGYTVTAQVQNYNQTEGNTDKKDYIKILKVKTEYTVGKKTEKMEVSTLITK